tara:strand:+ start:1839 stop:2336 length:498 start_codon:yes stop_codon:yes gene_type:complete
MKLLLLLLLLPLGTFAQENVIYKDLKTALINPELVYHLELKRKSLHEFPKQLFLFSNLKTLDLSKNKINFIPDSLAFLSGLHILNLSRNNIELIPNTIDQLESLQQLDLWDNYIEVLPIALKRLPKLKQVDIRGVALSYSKHVAYRELLKGVDLLMSDPCDCEEK